MNKTIMLLLLIILNVFIFGCTPSVIERESADLKLNDDYCGCMCRTKCNGEFLDNPLNYAYDFYSNSCLCECTLRRFELMMNTNLSCNSTEFISSQPFNYFLESYSDLIFKNGSAFFPILIINKAEYEDTFLFNLTNPDWFMTVQPSSTRILARNKSDFVINLTPMRKPYVFCSSHEIPIKIISKKSNFTANLNLNVYLYDETCIDYMDRVGPY